ncbi:MAG: flagellar biosynthetic protein FliP, partial [Sphingomonas sp.]
MSFIVIRQGSGPALIKAPQTKRGVPWGKVALVLLGIVFALILAHPAFAQAAPALKPPAAPGAGDAVDRALGDLGGGKAPLSLSLQILIIMGLLTILPGILLMMTSFTRIIIVLSILRQALGLQQTPPNQVLVGLSLFLSFFVMSPVISQINTTAIQP